MEEQAKLAGAGKKGAEAASSGPAVDDSKSIFIGNLDPSTTEEELKTLLEACGVVVRITIKKDYNRNPKGFAYAEFKEYDSVNNSILLNDTEFKGRTIKIVQKRTNIAGYRGRGRGYRGRGRGYRGRGRGRGRRGRGGYRGRKYFYSPY